MTVSGPIPFDEWASMRLLRSSVEYMKRTGEPMYQNAIEKEGSLYKRMLSEIKAA